MLPIKWINAVKALIPCIQAIASILGGIQVKVCSIPFCLYHHSYLLQNRQKWWQTKTRSEFRQSNTTYHIFYARLSLILFLQQTHYWRTNAMKVKVKHCLKHGAYPILYIIVMQTKLRQNVYTNKRTHTINSPIKLLQWNQWNQFCLNMFGYWIWTMLTTTTNIHVRSCCT